MDKIRLFDKTFKPYLSYKQISEAIDKVAEKINSDFNGTGETPVLACILNGSIMFTAELMQRLDFDCELISMKLSSYNGTQSTGQVKQVMGMTGSVKGKTVIVVEDIVETGNTIVRLKEIMAENGAKDVRFCTMLLKPNIYKQNVPLDYVAKEIPNDFIVGFGLDYNELGRNYKDIYVIDNE